MSERPNETCMLLAARPRGMAQPMQNLPLVVGSHPINSPVLLFSFSSQVCRVEKYSSKAPASILGWPVITFMASGQGFEPPKESILLKI